MALLCAMRFSIEWLNMEYRLLTAAADALLRLALLHRSATMVNGQTLDHRAKVSDQQIKRLVSKEIDVPHGEVKHGNSVSKDEFITVK